MTVIEERKKIRDKDLKGITGEYAFANLMDVWEIPFLPIDSQINMFSAKLKTLNLKRPDFILFDPKGAEGGKSPVYVDVKNRSVYGRDTPNPYVSLTHHECYRLKRFAVKFNVTVHLAILLGGRYLSVMEIADIDGIRMSRSVLGQPVYLEVKNDKFTHPAFGHEHVEGATLFFDCKSNTQQPGNPHGQLYSDGNDFF